MGEAVPPLPLPSIMNCDHCDKAIEGRVFWNGDRPLHGCCQITLARCFPGVSGFDHPNEEDPTNYNAAKSQSVNIGKMYRGEMGAKNKISDRMARRWHDLFVSNAEAGIHQEKQIPDSVIAESEERSAHHEKAAEDDRKARLARSTEVLRKIDGEIKSEGVSS